MVLQYFNVNDDIVQKSMLSLAKASTAPKNSPIIVGGMAVQIHCSDDKDALRSTSDIDLLYIPSIDSFIDFQNGIGGKIKNTLDETQYESQLKKIKHRDKYVVKVMNGQGNNAKELFHLHIDKSPFTNNNDHAYLNKKLSETAIAYEFQDGFVYIPRSEWIVARKVNRLTRKLYSSESSLEKSIYTNANSGKWGEIAKIPLQPWLDLITQQQNEITKYKNEKYNNYHINKDLYDLCLLARQIEGKSGFLNKAFYLKTKEDTDKYLKI